MQTLEWLEAFLSNKYFFLNFSFAAQLKTTEDKALIGLKIRRPCSVVLGIV